MLYMKVTMLLINIVAIQLAWISCIPIYCCSKQQLFLKQPLSKFLAWGLFVVLSLLSIALFNQIYHALEAVVFWLIVIMLGWVVIALAAPYCTRPRMLVPVMSLLFLLMGFLGQNNVA